MTRDLEQFLLDSIPLASHMKLKIVDFNETSLSIFAPLSPNTNDKGTAFAGSLFSAMVLAGWLYVTARLKAEGIDAEAVAAGADIQYVKPVTADYQAVCRLPDPSDWERFVTKLQKRKNYKIKLPVVVTVDGDVKARLNGDYIAWMRSLNPYGAH